MNTKESNDSLWKIEKGKWVNQETKWATKESKTCDRCGNKEVLRLISLPHRKEYISLCYICFHGLKKYFKEDRGLLETNR